MLKVIERAKVWFAISLTIIIVGMVAWAVKGLNLGIDFKGGTVVTIKMNSEPNNDVLEEIRKISAKYDSSAQVQKVGTDEVTIRGNSITDEQIPKLYKEIKDKYNLKDANPRQTDRIGPSIGKELRRNAIYSSLAAVVLMLIYISLRFEFKFGVAAVIALIHDVLVTITVYVLLQIPVNSSFVAAILTVLGYSINDTIVVFDRIRENNKKHAFATKRELVNASITQTLTRSINTVLTTLFTITALYLVGVTSVKDFALPLIIGILSGTYSSIFIASPIWYYWTERKIA
ncbi:protein translocase subunit SecF [Thermobrachium celere]|uniref:Protein-export membrane protein SecF n=2 Tax=Thermobrachium TaxID=150333 RepID=R7RSG9_9CLOT|nr:protein translocase subunit SecF [Thermobrachium celere]CDF58331.1 Protein-export membrane protein SecF (TC 3.A.5.1.1) [Thermobrachium celere DSM 8682]